MRRGVTDDIDAFRILVGDDAERDIAVDQKSRVDEIAVDFTGLRRFGQTGANALSDFGDGDRLSKLTL